MQRSNCICIVFCVLLLCSGAAWAQPSTNDTLQFTDSFMRSKLGAAAAHMADNLKAALAGTLKPQPAQAQRKVSVSCLHSVAPPPLNWSMWCPDSHASVTHWVDAVGSHHRRIELQAMPNMTAEMAMWFMTPLFPQTLTVNGKAFTKNQLWHPLDHRSKRQEFKMAAAAGKGLNQAVTMMSRLDEAYRSPKQQEEHSNSTAGRVYRTELWVTALDLPRNLPNNRYVASYDVLGFQALTIILAFNDSPNGLLASVEIIIGAAARGYDASNPSAGLPAKVARAVNTVLLEPAMRPYRANGDFDAAMDAVTRHVVEEMGNLPQFVPGAWWSAASDRTRAAGGAGQGAGKKLGLQAELAEFKKTVMSLAKPGAVNTTVGA